MPRPARQLARSVALRLPPLARFIKERDQWRARSAQHERRLKRQRSQIDSLRRENGELRERRATGPAAVSPGAEVAQLFPPGHFYSPIPDLVEVRARESEIFDRTRAALPGIDVRGTEQLELLPAFAEFQADMPFDDEPRDGLRYGFVNEYFSYGDGQALYSWLRHLRPRRLIEVGSGWSSALSLDVNERFFDGSMECTFIEPYPARLHSLLRPADRQRVSIIEEPLHAVPSSLFAELGAGDLLFIDSTHVSRVGSDVNRLLLDVVPALPPGVTVHVHDVFWPFEYPPHWVLQGRAWNEDYLLRALLAGNAHLQIAWFNDFLAEFHRNKVEEALPRWGLNPGGSIYLTTS